MVPALLETAVRQYISQAKDYENNAGFKRLVGMLQAQGSIDAVKKEMERQLQSLASDLPGLPLVEGAVSKRALAKMAQKSLAEKDWVQVVSQLCAKVEEMPPLSCRRLTSTALKQVEWRQKSASGMPP